MLLFLKGFDAVLALYSCSYHDVEPQIRIFGIFDHGIICI